MALTVYSSNRLENLADSLARELRERPQPPLTPEVVVVQSLGVRRWLSFALAERLGVAMHIEFPFPAHLVEQAFHALLPGSPVAPVFRRDVLPWRIHALLPELWNDPQFAGLRHYGSTDPLKLWQLAGQIAGVFDRYLAYRPQLLRAWDAGEDDPAHPWQSRLWRAAAARKPHPAALASRIATIPPSANSALPARINVFGLSTLPPFYLELLGELGRRTDVHMYLLSPSQEYWGDLRSEKEITRLRRWSERRGRTVPPTDEEVVHPLLASLGKIGREFHEAVLDLTPGREVTDFVEPTGAHLLAQVQRSILTLETPDEPMLLDPNDRSIQLHNCYSPLRELEVLHDQLLSLFANDPTLEPRDVLVSVPDISAYAPFVDAVFGAPESQKVQFPYSIADRDARAHNQVTDAFLRVLDLPGSRYTATQILSILDCPPVAAQFEIHPDELPLLRRWVAESGICWGRDDAHRERLGFPKWEENSWRFGLDRLLLGAAMPGGELCEGRLPHGDIEGALAQTLGKFATFCATVFRIADSFSAIVQSPEAWVETLREALAELCASDGDFADPWREAAQAIEAMGEQAKLAGSETPLTFPVVRGYLAHALAQTDRGNEFLRGGITFCSLKPMRAIPHRVVVLLGLNDGAFPRTARPPSFDLTASHPQPGDRTIRDDDRYLFLENILSARDVLYFSHCGQSAKDDSKSPPSVLLVEFLDYLSRAFRAPDGRSMQEHLTVSHPLQPFHRGYFDESAKHRLFSVLVEAAEAAKIAAMPRQEARPFVHRSDLTPATPREVSLDELSRFLRTSDGFFHKGDPRHAVAA